MFKIKFIALAFVATYLVFSAPESIGASSDEPVLLTIELSASEGDEPSVIEMRRSDLTAFPVTSFTTTTNWTTGPQTFTGVALSEILDFAGIESGQLEMHAINDYTIILDVEDPIYDGAVIAYLMNGKAMTPRSKGPLWLVYNYDSDRKYQTETIYSHSIWQLDRIVVSR